MNKTIKITLLTLLAVVLLFVSGIGYMMFNVKMALKDMNTLETGAVNETITALKDKFCNVYLVKGETGYIAIDSGKDPAALENEMKKVAVDPASVHTLFLTHADSDHAGGRTLFAKAQVFIPQAEEAVMNGDVARKFFLKVKADIPHTPVADGEIMTIDGVKVQCITIPGHTAGSSVYIINDEYLFCGDNFSINRNNELALFPDIFNADSKLQAESLQKIADLKGLKLILSPHYGTTENVDGLKVFKNIKEKVL